MPTWFPRPVPTLYGSVVVVVSVSVVVPELVSLVDDVLELAVLSITTWFVGPDT